MVYCKKCGGLVTADKDGARCSKCEAKAGAPIFKEGFKRAKKPLATTDKEVSGDVVNTACPFCGNKQATVTVLNAFYTDEEDTFILKCTKCNKSWREGYQW